MCSCFIVTRRLVRRVQLTTELSVFGRAMANDQVVTDVAQQVDLAISASNILYDNLFAANRSRYTTA